MASTPISTKTGEFARIAQFFRPLAAGFAGAFDLTDDAAAIAPSKEHELIVTTDTLVQGVHYIGDEAPAEIAKKLMRVNLSDLASMGAMPLAYTLNIALPKATGDGWLHSFCQGLREDQELYGVSLIGGDSVSTSGPIVLTLTAFGQVPSGMALRRNGARPGDRVFVSGVIGDAVLGLRVAKGGLKQIPPRDRSSLLKKYRYPHPRVNLGTRLRGLATACADVSDGLAADLGHIAETSSVAMQINMDRVPLSAVAARVASADPNLVAKLVTGGDDYELVFTAPPENAKMVAALAQSLDHPVTEIGVVSSGQGTQFLDAKKQVITLARLGFTHE